MIDKVLTLSGHARKDRTIKTGDRTASGNDQGHYAAFDPKNIPSWAMQRIIQLEEEVIELQKENDWLWKQVDKKPKP
jgi:hypothetical protein